MRAGLTNHIPYLLWVELLVHALTSMTVSNYIPLFNADVSVYTYLNPHTEILIPWNHVSRFAVHQAIIGSDNGLSPIRCQAITGAKVIILTESLDQISIKF